MDIRPIKNDADYHTALEDIHRLFGAEPGTPEGDKLEVLVTLVRAYENEHHPVPLPDPIDTIEYYMEKRGMTRRDLEPFIGPRSRVADIMNRRRSLTLKMIRALEAGLGIPPDILIQRYDLLAPYEEADTDLQLDEQQVKRLEAGVGSRRFFSGPQDQMDLRNTLLITLQSTYSVEFGEIKPESLSECYSVIDWSTHAVNTAIPEGLHV